MPTASWYALHGQHCRPVPPRLHPLSHPPLPPSCTPHSAVVDFHRDIGSAKPEEMGTALQRAFWLAKSVCDAAKVGWGLGAARAWWLVAARWGAGGLVRRLAGRAVAGLSPAGPSLGLGWACVCVCVCVCHLHPWLPPSCRRRGRRSRQQLPSGAPSHSGACPTPCLPAHRPCPAAVQQRAAHPAVHPQPPAPAGLRQVRRPERGLVGGWVGGWVGGCLGAWVGGWW